MPLTWTSLDLLPSAGPRNQRMCGDASDCRHTTSVCFDKLAPPRWSAPCVCVCEHAHTCDTHEHVCKVPTANLHEVRVTTWTHQAI